MVAEDERKLEAQLANLRAELAKARRKNANSTVGSYTFKTEHEDVTLVELFQSKQDLLIIHNMGSTCPYCTAYADGINGVLRHLEERASVILLSNDTPSSQKAFSLSRGWNFKLVSAVGTSFSKDMGFEPKPEEFWPGIMGFRKHGNTAVLVSKTYFDPGDDLCVIWPLMSFLEGGVNEWEPNIESDFIELADA